jgi:hypothetical protein
VTTGIESSWCESFLFSQDGLRFGAKWDFGAPATAGDLPGIKKGQSKNFSRKIQSIYNGKCAPITMQGFAQASENPPPQEQWKTMEKQRAEQSEQSEDSSNTTVRREAADALGRAPSRP